MKLIVTDLFNVSVNDIGNWFNAIKDGEEYQKVVDLIAGDVFGTRTIKEYLEDIGNETVTKIVNKAALKKLVADETLVMVIDEIMKDIKANEPVTILTHYFGDAKVGELVQIALDDLKYDGTNWVNGATVMKLIVTDLFNVSVNDIGNWFNAIKDGEKAETIIRTIVKDIADGRYLNDYLADIGNETINRVIAKDALDKLLREETVVMVTDEIIRRVQKGDYLGLVVYYFGDIKIGQFAQLFDGRFTEEKDVWSHNGNKVKLIVTDLFNITVNDIEGWRKTIFTDNNYKKAIKDIASDVFGERTFEDYTKDFGLNIISEKALFEVIRETKVSEFVQRLVDAETTEDRLDYLRTFIMGVKIGAIAEVAGVADSPNGGDKWTTSDKKEITYALSDLLDLTFDDVIDMFFARKGKTLPSWQNRVSTLVSKYTKADKHTLKVYIEDAVGKAINVKGLADLSDIRIAELVAVALKVKTDVIADENGTLVKFNAVSQLPEDFKQLIIYVCNITDKVLLGDYLTKLDNVTGGVYRDNDGKWFNKTEEVTGILKTIYDIPTTYLFGVILAIAQPQLILDAIGGYKIGQIIQKPYNEALTYFNSAIRNNKSDYYVEGSFKEVMEEFVNISVLDIYNDIKDGKFIENVKNKFVLDREVGDYLFDVIAQLAKKASKLNSGLDGYAYENVNETTGKYELNGNFKVVYETILNLRFKEDMIDQGKNIGTHLKEIFEKLYLGDIFYDLARHVSKGKICEGYAFENFASHGDKFELEKSLAAVISATFNIQIADITKCFKGNVGVNFKKLFEDAYTGLTVGDFTYDLFRKFVAKKLSLSAKGYAYDYKKDNTLLQGKIAKLMRATFNIKLGDLNNLVKDFAKPEGRTIKTIILDFVSKIYGNLEIGDVIGAVMEKLTATKLQMVYEYDEEYNLTVKGNFKEIANSVYSEKLANLIAAVKENTVRTYFIGDKEGTTDGVVGKHIAGDLFGYILKSKAFKGFTKYTTVERDDNANEWIAEKAFSHPINILFNDLTISALLRGMDHPRSFLIKHFGNVLLGELLGKYKVDNVWYMVDGKQEEMTAENGGVIMKHVYEITFEQILDEDFNINTAIADIYVGELIGYSHCGKKYTKTDEKHSAYILCKKAEHVDNADGYHIHADECNVSGHDHGANTYEPGWYKTTGGVVSEVGAVEGVMADMRLGHILGNQNFSCGDLFGDMRIGEVLDYKYCDKNGASGKCTVESHTDATHNARTSITWYVKDGATYKMAGALERTIANVKMKDILNGSFDVDATLKTLKLGNLMNYEYCDGAMDSTECFLTHTHRQGWYQLTDEGEWKLISREFYCDGLANSKHCAAELNHDHTSAMVYKAGWYHMEDGSWIINYEGDAISEGKRMNNNIMLCIFDYSMDGLRGNDFSKDLIDSINVKVLIGDIYDPSTATGPLKLVSPNTPIGEISTAIETAMDTATAKELKDCGLLPIKEDTGLKMNTIYGATLMMSYDTTTGTWKPSTDSDGIVAATGTEAEANAALAAHNIADYGGDYVAYEKAVGETYWNSLTIDKLVNVLLTRVESL